MIHQGQEKTVTLTLATLPNEKQASNGPNQDQREVPDSDVPKLGLTLAPASKVSGANASGVASLSQQHDQAQTDRRAVRLDEDRRRSAQDTTLWS
jgi:serine protease Do